ncbi:hypothetical protein D920_01014, partial [Enterococcus faecalis 13-SD-W-01]
KELVHEHRLGRGCENDGLLQEIRTKKQKWLLTFMFFWTYFRRSNRLNTVY